MAAIRGTDSTPERVVRSTLHRLGYRFTLHRADLPGKPDIVMPARGAVVFVHGCYWHLHTCKRGRSTPATNTAFWRAKRTKNRERDRKTLAKLRRAGWRVLVVWECQTLDSSALRDRKTLAKLRRAGWRVLVVWECQTLDSSALRDRKTLAKLRRAGWRVLVVWECQTLDSSALRDRLSRFLLH